MSVKKGELLAIVGRIGSGKTSLLSALLGEIPRASGTVKRGESAAYVSQQAWVLNQSLRENILFGMPFNKEKYDAILDACCLRPDLAQLPAGDLTEIGEKGINLRYGLKSETKKKKMLIFVFFFKPNISGGQKQRISLARSIYADRDIYLLDDTLSAVDVHVGKSIFHHVIKGLLKEKTVLLVTHQLQFLPECDRIVVLSHGKIAEQGLKIFCHFFKFL